jgi:hypothetical protein
MKKAVRRALRNLSIPGSARTWFVPILVEALEIYYELQSITLRQRPLSKALGKQPRQVFSALLKKSGRDRRTRSRWTAALNNAVKAGIASDDLAEWLRKGGGVSGRAKRPSSPETTTKTSNPQTPSRSTWKTPDANL